MFELTNQQRQEVIALGRDAFARGDDVATTTTTHGAFRVVWEAAASADEWMSFDDAGDCNGEIDTVTADRRLQRPTHFDGAARKLRVGWGGGDVIWWQPPADMVSDHDAMDNLAKCVADLLTYGWDIWMLRAVILEPGDEYEGDCHGWDCHDATIGGIESTLVHGCEGNGAYAIGDYLLDDVASMVADDLADRGADMLAEMARVTGMPALAGGAR